MESPSSRSPTGANTLSLCPDNTVCPPAPAGLVNSLSYMPTPLESASSPVTIKTSKDHSTRGITSSALSSLSSYSTLEWLSSSVFAPSSNVNSSEVLLSSVSAESFTSALSNVVTYCVLLQYC